MQSEREIMLGRALQVVKDVAVIMTQAIWSGQRITFKIESGPNTAPPNELEVRSCEIRISVHPKEPTDGLSREKPPGE